MKKQSKLEKCIARYEKAVLYRLGPGRTLNGEPISPNGKYFYDFLMEKYDVGERVIGAIKGSLEKIARYTHSKRSVGVAAKLFTSKKVFGTFYSYMQARASIFGGVRLAEEKDKFVPRNIAIAIGRIARGTKDKKKVLSFIRSLKKKMKSDESYKNIREWARDEADNVDY
ncbi:hypothetical protein ACFLZZ_02795 [Nanoarchaeota archaeon]